MTTNTGNIPTGLERFNALLTWWGTPNGTNFGNIEVSTKGVEELVSDLSQAFNETSSCQVKTMTATNEQLAKSMQDLLRARQPQELMAAQSSIVSGLLEGLAAQTKNWAELTQKVQGCCATMVRESAEEAARQVGSAASAMNPAQAEPDQPVAKGAGKNAVHA